MQEPQSADKIDACVRTKFSVGFRMLEKALVNGADTHPVFRWLRLKGGDAGAITWNFNMFLVGRDGESCTRFANSRTPASIKAEIVSALDGTAPQPASTPAEHPPNEGCGGDAGGQGEAATAPFAPTGLVKQKDDLCANDSPGDIRAAMREHRSH